MQRLTAWLQGRRRGGHASLGTRLSRIFALQALAGLGAVCLAIYLFVGWALDDRASDELVRKTDLVRLLLEHGAHEGREDMDSLRGQLDTFFKVHTDLSLTIAAREGREVIYRSPVASGTYFRRMRQATFDVAAAEGVEQPIRVVLQMDQSPDDNLLRRLAWALAAVACIGAAAVGTGGYWVVRRGLAPLRLLAQQTRALSARRLDQRLSIEQPVEELMPWIEQVNELLGRLERAWQQAEGFNADVAHELRTPLAILTGETELLLTGGASTDFMRDTLASNLEELRRLSTIVNDMLFLSRADRGAEARRTVPGSLAAEVHAVAEFHEAAFEERDLTVQVTGDCVCSYDQGLVRRAISNLLGNASRYADRESTIWVEINRELRDGTAYARIAVANKGTRITPEVQSRMFDRFFRADCARQDARSGHHGLGLAIVAAIVRMHGGQVGVTSTDHRITVFMTVRAVEQKETELDV